MVRNCRRGSSWRNGNWRLDYNDYWDTTGSPIKPAGTTFEQWQQRGNDVHSIVADPGFADARNGDFGIKPDSPAVKIGFRPIDASQIGITRSAPGEHTHR